MIQAVFLFPGYLDKEEKRLALEEHNRKNEKCEDETNATTELQPDKEMQSDVPKSKEQEEVVEEDEQFEEPTSEPRLVDKKIK